MEISRRDQALMAVSEKDFAKVLDRIKIRGSEDCWLWTGRVTAKGYPRWTLQTEGQSVDVFVHRLLAWIHHGPPPVEGPWVHRTCGAANCLNPAHLFWGPDQRKVPEETILEALRRVLSGESMSEVARAMGLKYNTLYTWWSGSKRPELLEKAQQMLREEKLSA
jgi:transposase-like protein